MQIQIYIMKHNSFLQVVNIKTGNSHNRLCGKLVGWLAHGLQTLTISFTVEKE